MSSFVHLHVHSEFSLLDGLARLPDLCQQAKAYGMESLALTDHGQMYGMVKFHRAAEEAGIKPIYGCEVYQAPRRMDQKEPRIDGKTYHLLLLAKNMTGYRNLMQLVTRANLEGFYYRPRIDKELLAKYAEGLICASACISGEVPSLIAARQLERARQAVGWFKEVFGPDNYYLELQRHQGVPELERVNEQLVKLGKEFGLRCVVTNDVHYVRKGDASAQELLLAVQTNTTLSDPNRMRMGSDDYYLMSPEEMAALMPEYPEALENTVRIAEQCEVDLGFKGYHLPTFEVPGPGTAQEYLRTLCEEGVTQRYQEVTPEIRQRLEHELDVIHTMGFDDYFLINADLVLWAKKKAKMLVGPGRGSGASSLVSYVLGITELEPLSLGLIFERFLNPGRITMPDIDLDYPEDRRQEVIDYLTRKYGEDRTSQIATFGTMAARGAIRDVGRALGVPLDEVDHVAKLIPSGPKKKIQDGLDDVPELKALYESQAWVKKLIDNAQAVQGVARHFSTHAAGVLIADKPLVEYTPLQRAPRGEGIISQFCMEDVEEIGLLKLDVLGLSTLTVLDRALKWIARTNGTQLTLEGIPLDDPDTYALLSSGKVTGIFQVESSGMRRILRDMQPTEFKEIVAILALYRPGPMQFIPNYINRKFGKEEVHYLHPSLKPILEETYGIIVYQEQIIQIASEIAGYTPAEADLMRRAVGHKIKEALEQQHARFVKGAMANGVPEKTAEAVFADIELFANYGFNKSHSAAYAVITLQTAYLKAHYPIEFMAALLSVERGNLEKVATLIGECRRNGIAVRPPDVNCADIDFSIEPYEFSILAERGKLLSVELLAIRFGLGAIKNVGDGLAELILEGRGDTPFADIDDFVNRVDLRQISKRVLECLIRAGAFDSLGERSALLALSDKMIAISQQVHRAREIGQSSLFDLNPELMGQAAGTRCLPDPQVPALPERKCLADEKELLGTYMSRNPLDLLTRYVDERLTPLADITTSLKGEQVQVAGIVDSVRTITTKKGDPMAFAQVEDLSGMLDLVIFPRMYEDAKGLLVSEGLMLIRATVNVRDDKPNLIVDTMAPYTPPKGSKKRLPMPGGTKHLRINISLDRNGQAPEVVLNKVIDLLVEHQGDIPFTFQLSGPQGQVEMIFPNIRTAYSPQLEQQIAALIEPDRFGIEWA